MPIWQSKCKGVILVIEFLEKAVGLYDLGEYEISETAGHEG